MNEAFLWCCAVWSGLLCGMELLVPVSQKQGNKDGLCPLGWPVAHGMMFGVN